MSGAADSMIEVQSLVKRYGGKVALDGVSFTVPDGITGLLGENGAGKSTAIRILLGLTAPSSGTARVLGREASSTPEVRARLGYMPEHDCLPSQPSAAEFLTHIAETSGLPRRIARTRAADTLRHTGLFEERYRPIGGYSTGMKQRVKLAQALVHDPAYVFLDEPTAGLDPLGREEMLHLVRRTHREFGIGILLSTHLMSDVERTCDRIIVLEGGHLVHAGEVSGFTTASMSLFVEVDDNRAAFLDALARRGVVATPDGAGVSIEGADDVVYDMVRDALVDAEAPLRRMAPRRHSLTELFTDRAAPALDGAA